MKFNYKWTFADYPKKKNGLKVFSCFACGGGSTMGYKLAGFDVLGFNEIDPRMAVIYQANHKPKYAFTEDIRQFKNRTDIPAELYELDILDGSPPCSSFSTAGAREEGWGKEKKFREGQAKQTLDDLFFDFIDVAKKLQPKVVIAENVKGLLLGEAQTYVDRIYKAFDAAGYYANHWLLVASSMGVPQKRERVFFVAVRKDISAMIDCDHGTDLFNPMPFVNMEFNEPEIPFKDIFVDMTDRPLSPHYQTFWDNKVYGDQDFSNCSARMGKNPNAQFNYGFLYMHKPCLTVAACTNIVLFDYPRYLNRHEIISASSFPIDYDFGKEKPGYVCGMSVPPVMAAQVATRVKEYIFDRLKVVAK